MRARLDARIAATFATRGHGIGTFWYDILKCNSKIVNLKFPGRGQCDTPGAEIETMIEIIMLLGAAAASYPRRSSVSGLSFSMGENLRGHLIIINKIWYCQRPEKLAASRTTNALIGR